MNVGPHICLWNHEISESKPMAEKQQKRSKDCLQRWTKTCSGSLTRFQFVWARSTISESVDMVVSIDAIIRWFSTSEPCQIAAKDHVITRHSMPMPNLTNGYGKAVFTLLFTWTLGKFQTHWAQENHRPTSRGSLYNPSVNLCQQLKSHNKHTNYIHAVFRQLLHSTCYTQFYCFRGLFLYFWCPGDIPAWHPRKEWMDPRAELSGAGIGCFSGHTPKRERTCCMMLLNLHVPAKQKFQKYRLLNVKWKPTLIDPCCKPPATRIFYIILYTKYILIG